MEHLEYLLASLPVRETGSPAMCRSLDNGVLGQDGSS
ncbi:hypothetical protein GGE07_002891 [Sinorhizobium terangae]|nr:hypothetical protein [Sinorhizobium terangae]